MKAVKADGARGAATSELLAIANDVAWAFGLKDAHGAPVVFAPPPPGRHAQRPKPARDPRPILDDALSRVRPVASAPSILEVLRALAALDPMGASPPYPDPASTKASRSPPRVRRRLVAELDELVAQGTHLRAKRQERKRILGELVILFGLEPVLAITSPSAKLDARVDAIAEAVDAILER